MEGGSGRPVRDLDELLADCMLDDQGRADFAHRRDEIIARYGGWRHNFPSFAVLLDSETERAEALAGNYATQGHATIEAWADLQIALNAGRIDPSALGRLEAWIDDYLVSWRLRVRSEVDFGDREEPDQSFREVFDDLLEKARTRTKAQLNEAAAVPKQRWTAMMLLPLAWLGSLLRRAFFPEPRP